MISTYCIIALCLSALLLCVSAFVSASEVAFFALSPSDIEEFEGSGSANAKRVLRLLETPQKLLATILIANNFVNIIIIILLTYVIHSVFDFSHSPLLAFLVETVVITFLLLLFGEIMPKVFSSQNSRRMALGAAMPMSLLVGLLSPLSKILVKSTSLVGTRHKAANDLSMEQLGEALSLTSDTPEQEKDMLEGIIRFGNIDVADIMCPRVDMVDIDISSDYASVMNIMVESGYSRVPVYEDSNDNIKGILYSKDLIAHLSESADFHWQALIREPYFVPEGMKIDELLHQFQERKVHLAIVVDEFGGTSGLVTMEDILEEIVGDISDEYDDEEPTYQRVDDNTYIFEGKTLLTDFFRWTGIDEQQLEDISTEAETLAGLVLEIRGEIPKKGDVIRHRNCRFEVLAADKRRIKSIKFSIDIPQEL